MTMYSVVITDDHLLFAKSLKMLIDSVGQFRVLYQVNNGKQLIDRLQESTEIPDVILLDINMPVLNGLETMKWLHTNRPQIKVLVLSMDDREESVIAMLRHGANGYLLKDSDPSQLQKAIMDVVDKGFHYSEKVNQSLLHTLNPHEEIGMDLNDRELEFLRLSCSERTYKEIAEEMYLSPKTIDGYRENLFKKLNVKSRIGLVLFAIKKGIYEVE